MLGESGSSAGAGAAGFLVLVIGAGFYFIPTIVAAIRKVPNVGSIIVINLFLGWTLIGWVVALAMAARSVPAASTQINIQQGRSHPSGTSSPPPPPPPPLPPESPSG